MNKETNINDLAITIEVEQEVIDTIRIIEESRLTLDISDYNQNVLLENIEGNLILCTEELPMTYHGCYYYNDGSFPYIIKKDLQFIILSSGNDSCLTHIKAVKATPGKRFRFQESGIPSVEDPNGDSCIWDLTFSIEYVRDGNEDEPMRERKTYLLRWNPAISSFTEDDYEEFVTNAQDDAFELNWSVYEWEDAAIGDRFYMMRVGDEKAGFVFRGHFISTPYTADDWAGSNRQRHYVDLLCVEPVTPKTKPDLSLEKLKAALPEINWASGHSGILLPKEVAEKLEELWAAN